MQVIGLAGPLKIHVNAQSSVEPSRRDLLWGAQARHWPAA